LGRMRCAASDTCPRYSRASWLRAGRAERFMHR
jgi:hypothetical protein